MNKSDINEIGINWIQKLNNNNHMLLLQSGGSPVNPSGAEERKYIV